MDIVTQWIRKRREQCQLLQDRKKHEAEQQIQRETQDYECSRALQLNLRFLQHTIDPLMASQAYNNRFCPFTRLPEELILNVLDFFRGDDVTLCCLRITSRIFLRLLHCRSAFWTKYIYTDPPGSLGHDLRLQFRRLLQRDGRCDNCSRWNDAHVRCFLEPCKFQGSCLRSKPRFLGRECWYLDYDRPHCSICDTDHDVCQFPLAYQQLPSHQHPGPRPCLGQQGSVQLCEHVHITWTRITAHIDDCRRRHQQRGEGGQTEETGAKDDWQACLDSFTIECHDPTLDTRCTASEAEIWPRARLGISDGFSSQDPDIVVLFLEWTPHGRIDALLPTVEGCIPAAGLRALFQRFRQLGPADILYPPGRPESLPEMACFTRSFPIHYNMGRHERRGKDAENTLTPLPTSRRLPPSSDQWKSSVYHQTIRDHSKIGRNSQRLSIKSHSLSGNSCITSQCLIVSYQKGIMICKTTALANHSIKLIPSHHWLHAMDPRTYPHQQARVFRPQCRDDSCDNYCRRMKDYCLSD